RNARTAWWGGADLATNGGIDAGAKARLAPNGWNGATLAPVRLQFSSLVPGSRHTTARPIGDGACRRRRALRAQHRRGDRLHRVGWPTLAFEVEEGDRGTRGGD